MPPQGPRPGVLPSCWPPPTRSSAGTSRPSGGTCKAAHRSSGERGPRQTSLGPRKPVLGVSGRVTEHKHLASPGTRGARALWAETESPPPQFHTDMEEQMHICPQQVRHGVSVRGLSNTAPNGDNPNIYQRLSGHGNGSTFTARSHTATSGQMDTCLMTGLNLQHTPARRSRPAGSTLLHNMDMKLQNS